MYKYKAMQKTQKESPQPVIKLTTRDIPNSQKIQHNMPAYNFFKIILITLRLIPVSAIMCFVILFQQYICPRVMIPQIRRYLSCIVNLICIRIVLLLFGFFRFQCENYRYFDKAYRMMTFRSGWVGVAPRQNIIDFLYYSYLFNPTYVRIIEYHSDQQNNNQTSQNSSTQKSILLTKLYQSQYQPVQKQKKDNIKVFYTPLTFKQSFLAALHVRGFDPIVVKGKQQFKKLKRRKMPMNVLISECFQQLNGPVMIFLPTLGVKQLIPMHEKVSRDIYDNQKKFVRSGVIFMSQVQQNARQPQQKLSKQSNQKEIKNNNNTQKFRKIAHFFKTTHLNQLILMCEICSQLKMNILNITATQTIKFKYEYHQESYHQFIQQIYAKNGYTVIGSQDCLDDHHEESNSHKNYSNRNRLPKNSKERNSNRYSYEWYLKKFDQIQRYKQNYANYQEQHQNPSKIESNIMKIEENANPSTDISKNNQNKAENDNSEIKENTNGNIDVGSTKAGLLQLDEQMLETQLNKNWQQIEQLQSQYPKIQAITKQPLSQAQRDKIQILTEDNRAYHKIGTYHRPTDTSTNQKYQ